MMRLEKDLDPFEALSAGLHPEPESGFQKFRAMVRNAGFHDAFLGTTPLVREISSERNLIKPIGVFFAPDFEKLFFSDPLYFAKSRNVRSIVLKRKTVSFVDDEYWKSLPPESRERYEPIFQEFKIRAFHLPPPIVFPGAGFQASINLFDNISQKEFRRVLDAKRTAFLLAATYYLTGFARLRQYNSMCEVALSHREHECLLWAAAGYTTEQISDKLSLSTSTVNIYFRRAQKKLGARNRTHACAIAIAEGLAKP